MHKGIRVPDVTFKTRVRDESIVGTNPYRWQDMTTADFFAGKRVIQDTVREELPEDFQTAEYLREHGMVDIVVPRSELRARLAQVISLLRDTGAPSSEPVAAIPPPEHHSGASGDPDDD